MPRLHVSEAADFFWNGAESHREGVILRRELAHDLAEQRLVVGDQLALGAALFRVAEDVERRAAQEPEFRQRAEYGQHPGAEGHFLRHARDRILFREQRRREMEFERELV